MVALAVEGVDGGAVCTHACYSLRQDWKRVGVNVLPCYLHHTSMRDVSQEQQRKQHRHLQTTVRACTCEVTVGRCRTARRTCQTRNTIMLVLLTCAISCTAAELVKLAGMLIFKLAKLAPLWLAVAP